MTVNLPTYMRHVANRWVAVAFAGLLCLSLAPSPTLAQNGGDEERQQKMEQLKQSFNAGRQAAQADNREEAYSQFEQALELAQELEQESAARQVRGKFLVPLSKKWGNEALENENYEQAELHFNKGIEYTDSDAYMHYGLGLALINQDQTEEAFEALQRAIEIGNQTGDTRTAGLATERIRDEFLARASEALNAQNPTNQQANAAIEALDEMREYVDPSAQSLFYRARALYERGDFEQAVQAAQSGLDMHQGSRSDAAGYYFVIGESQMELGQTAQACQTFQQATYGDYRARAEHYLENECQ